MALKSTFYENIMNKKKIKALDSKGYNIGSVDNFLGLNKEESEYIDLKLVLRHKH